MKSFNRSRPSYSIEENNQEIEEDFFIKQLFFLEDGTTQKWVKKHFSDSSSYEELKELVYSSYPTFFRKKVKHYKYNNKKTSQHICVLELEDGQYLELIGERDRDDAGYLLRGIRLLPQYPYKEDLGEPYLLQGQAVVCFSTVDRQYRASRAFEQLYKQVEALEESPDALNQEKERQIWSKYVEAYQLLLDHKKKILKAKVVEQDKKGFLHLDIIRTSIEERIREKLDVLLEPPFELEGKEEELELLYLDYEEIGAERQQQLQEQLSPLFITLQRHQHELEAHFSLKQTSQEYKKQLMGKLRVLLKKVGLSCEVNKQGFCEEIAIEKLGVFSKVIAAQFAMLEYAGFEQIIQFEQVVQEAELLQQLHKVLRDSEYTRANTRAIERKKGKLCFIIPAFNARIVPEIEQLGGFKHQSIIAEYWVNGKAGEKGEKLKDIEGFERNKNSYRKAIAHTSEFKQLKKVLEKEFPNATIQQRASDFLFSYQVPALKEKDVQALNVDLLEYLDDITITAASSQVTLKFSDKEDYKKKIALLEEVFGQHSLQLQPALEATTSLNFKQEYFEKEQQRAFNRLENKIKNLWVGLPFKNTIKGNSQQLYYRFETERERQDIVYALEDVAEELGELLVLSIPTWGRTRLYLKQDFKKAQDAEKQFYNHLREADFKYETPEEHEKTLELEALWREADARINQIKNDRESVSDEAWKKLHKISRDSKEALEKRWKKDLGSVEKVQYKQDKHQLLVELDGRVPVQKLLQQSIYLLPRYIGEESVVHRMRAAMKKVTASNSSLINPKLANFLFDPYFATDIIEEDSTTTQEDYQRFLDTRLEKQLNKKQEEAVLKALKAKDLMLLQGPPGTGKTTVIAEMLWQIIWKDQTHSTLVSSQANLAVDNALDRLPDNKVVRPLRLGGSRKKAYTINEEGERVEDKKATAKKQLEHAQKFEEGFKFSKVVLTIWQEQAHNSELERQARPNKVQAWLKTIQEQVSKRQEEQPQFKQVLEDWKQQLASPQPALKQLFTQQYLKYVNIVAATCMECGTREFSQEFEKGFTYVIVDEASKATPPELILPLTYGRTSIIIGDHKQLPPMIKDRQLEEALELVGAKELMQDAEVGEDVFKVAQFEKLFKQAKVGKPSLITELDTQYRMHADIMAVINQFYQEIENSEGGKGLICGLDNAKMNTAFDYQYSNGSYEKASRDHGLQYGQLLSPNDHVLWVDVNTPEIKTGTTYYNEGEIRAIEAILKNIQSASKFQAFQNRWSTEEEREIGVITFYGAQLQKLRKLAPRQVGKDGRRRRYYNNIPIRIDTVDRFQGMERNILIVSTVRSGLQQQEGQHQASKPNKSLGFATDPRRINVAFSRARRLLIIVGNKAHFSESPLYKEVIKTVAKHGHIISSDLL